MLFLQPSLSSLLALFLVLAACGDAEPLRRFHMKAVNNYTTLYVDPSGYGHFSSIQSAIDHIPSNNEQWVRIYIKAGIYNEQILIPSDKPFIYIQGEGKWKTRVIWGGSGPIITCATLISQADNIVIKSVSFTNSYNHPPGSNKNQIKAAVAAMISGDKSAFYRCAFLGFQDTLWDDQGRHYFKLCTIQGAVDFIFGDGQSIYERCTVSVVAGALRGLTGFITAQGRNSPTDPSGFIFKDCNVIGDGTTYLGRPWRDYARVIFYNTSMSNVVVPQGWNAWGFTGHEYQLTFAEHDCHGIGANTSGRVGWEHKLSDEMVKKLTDLTFIDNDGWIIQQPFSMVN
nr:probable pectinesterase 29 [Coffea arabica]